VYRNSNVPVHSKYDDMSNYGTQFDWNISNATEYNYILDSDWCEPGGQEVTIKTFQTCVFCMIFPLGVVGNCLVIATFAIYRSRCLRSMTDVFLFHLALADLLLVLTLPLQAIDTLGWTMPMPLCKIMRACYAINTYSGLLLLACISVDRYLVVAQPKEMLQLRSWIFTVGTVGAVGVWLVAVLLSLPEILFSGESGPGSVAVYCGVKMATNGAIIAVFCLSFLVMVMCYSLIAKVLWEGQVHRRGRQWHRQRTLKLMVALVLVFLVFQLPYTVVLLHKLAGQFCGLLPEYITCTLAYTRCCLNPILYALVGVRFRKDVLKLMYNSGCFRRHHLVVKTASSASPSSLTLTVLSVASPTSSGRIFISNDTVSPT
uniref:G-protein coupled receptors family 1 profile domain-containing protein n=1 Tax=Mola mola TaxID=94237 RepID=A0A3Q3VSU9_MOLML